MIALVIQLHVGHGLIWVLRAYKVSSLPLFLEQVCYMLVIALYGVLESIIIGLCTRGIVLRLNK